jgi:hypothetical protein
MVDHKKEPTARSFLLDQHTSSHHPQSPPPSKPLNPQPNPPQIQIITQSNFKKELKSLTENEDQWYYEKLIELPAKEDGSPGARLPDKETAKGFAVQMVWDERPVGYHQVQLWNKEEEKLRAIESYCPEWRLMKEGWWE